MGYECYHKVKDSDEEAACDPNNGGERDEKQR
jgi:hypothetical protein